VSENEAQPEMEISDKDEEGKEYSEEEGELEEGEIENMEVEGDQTNSAAYMSTSGRDYQEVAIKRMQTIERNPKFKGGMNTAATGTGKTGNEVLALIYRSYGHCHLRKG